MIPWCSKWSGAGAPSDPLTVPEKLPGGFGAERGQVQQGSGEGSGEGAARYYRVLEKVPEKRWPGDSIFVESELHNFKSLSGEAQRLGFWRSLQSHINLLICKFFLSRHDASARMQGKRWSGALAIMVGIDYPGKKNQWCKEGDGMGRSFSKEREGERERLFWCIYIIYCNFVLLGQAWWSVGTVVAGHLRKKRFRRMEEVPCKLQSSRSFVA